MDIEYLLWLQNLRNSLNCAALDKFMEGISFFAISYIFLIFGIIYWGINKRSGLYIMASFAFGDMVNSLAKLVACIRRPWIRDARIIPAGNAIETATGYSFPSGHTSVITQISGGTAVCLRRAGYKLFSWLFIALILVVGFSRNYLGVHTPQDVVVGLCIGLITLYVMSKIFAFIDKHQSSENLFLILGLIFAGAILYYVNVKDYPVYEKIDPKVMVNDTWASAGRVLGLVLGRFVEKYCIKFTPEGFNLKSCILIVIGLVIFGLEPILIGNLGAYYGRMANGFLCMFFVLAVWPVVLKIFQGSK